MPDCQDQIAAAGFFQQPYRRVGVYLNDPYRVRFSADIGKHVDGGDAKSKRVSSLSRQCERGLGTGGLEYHRSPRAQVDPPGNVPAFALARTGAERGLTGTRN